MKVHIVAPDIRAGDAVGNHCLYLAKALRQCGIETALYAKRNTSDGKIQPIESLLDEAQIDQDDVLLLSYSTFQPRLSELLALRCKKSVYFHGVTPTEHLLDHDPAAAYWSSKAFLQLPMLARCDQIVANTQWNLNDLLLHLPSNVDGHRLSVIPPITPDMPLFQRKPRGPFQCHHPLRLLTVGRLAPHKKIEDVIRLTEMLNTRGTSATLVVIGSATSEDYANHLTQLAQELCVSASVEFRGHVSDESLAECFSNADLLVSASLHEGFCIPVLEALFLGLPAAIRRGTAASEVAGDMAIEFDTPEQAVDSIIELMTDESAVNRTTLDGKAVALKLIQKAELAQLIGILHRL